MEDNTNNSLHEDRNDPMPRQEPVSEPPAQDSYSRPTYQSGITYSYGRYGVNPVPEATQNGAQYGSGQPQNGAQYTPAQSPYSQSYGQTQYGAPPYGGSPYAAPQYAPPQPEPQKPKKPRKGLSTFLTVALTAVSTAALLLLLLWGVGVLDRPMPINADSSLPSETEASQSSEPSKPDSALLPDADKEPSNAFDLSGRPEDEYEPMPAEDGSLSPKEVARKVKPSVVCIQNFASQDLLSEQSTGSGVIMSEDGYIITNAHVVEQAKMLKVVLFDGRILNAQLIGADPSTDLAVIKVEGEDLIAAEFGDSDALEQGEFVMAIGNPGGLAFSNSVTFGTVSAVNRSVNGGSGYTMPYIQTDAAINPGNSGGALVNMYGQVVGINSAKIVANGYEGLGFAIPTNAAQPVVSDLKQFGYVKGRAYLGIGYQFVTEEMSRAYRLPVGMYIGDFYTSTMSDAGCEVGDIITMVEETPITSTSVMLDLLATKKPGDTLTMTVYRSSSNETFEVSVVLGESQPRD